MVIAGLTGGIATGKSTVSKILDGLGAHIVDADKIAREAVSPGMPAWEDIKRVFGKDVLSATGEVDREALGRIVFSDPLKRGRLEEIVHPEVRRIMDERIRSIHTGFSDAVVVLDVPLLIETRMDKGLDEVIVVYCPEDVQIKRLMDRDRISREDALARVRAQMPIEEKKLHATMLVDNSRSLDETKKQVEDAYLKLMQKAVKNKR